MEIFISQTNTKECLPFVVCIINGTWSTPIRVVFNGSFGYEALNKLLWKGNAHGLDVFDHLMRFRKGQFAFTADLSKAFLQVMIHPDDRKFLKFLWKNKNNVLNVA